MGGVTVLVSERPHIVVSSTWLRGSAPEISGVDFSFYLDQLSLVMLLVVTGVGFLIHIYSVGYMWEEGGFYRFFAYLNLFMFFMLTLVLAKQLPADVHRVGRRGSGVVSADRVLVHQRFGCCRRQEGIHRQPHRRLRISDCAVSADQAFRIARLHAGICQSVIATARGDWRSIGLLTSIGLLLMVGAAGKSAQIPLYVWLPDAMEGPTPVSALIHAATMVTAGVYMVARSHVIFDRAPMALTVVAIVGTLTASVRGHHRHRADRYQESSRLLHRLAAGLHVHGLRRRRLLGRHLPSDDACILQRVCCSWPPDR